MCPIPNGFRDRAIWLYSGLAVEEYRRRFPMRRIPDRRVFSKVFNTLREWGTLPTAHVSSERARKQNMEEQENILDMLIKWKRVRRAQLTLTVVNCCC
jgi:hypothetical protein